MSVCVQSVFRAPAVACGQISSGCTVKCRGGYQSRVLQRRECTRVRCSCTWTTRACWPVRTFMASCSCVLHERHAPCCSTRDTRARRLPLRASASQRAIACGLVSSITLQRPLSTALGSRASARSTPCGRCPRQALKGRARSSATPRSSRRSWPSHWRRQRSHLHSGAPHICRCLRYESARCMPEATAPSVACGRRPGRALGSLRRTLRALL